MEETKKIRNRRELEFAIFCIENIAIKTGKDAEWFYRALTEETDILNEYIVPEYEMLHTQDKEYIVNDILDLMREKGVKI